MLRNNFFEHGNLWKIHNLLKYMSLWFVGVYLASLLHMVIAKMRPYQREDVMRLLGMLFTVMCLYLMG